MIIHTAADLGAAIRAARRASGLGQHELAARIGVARQWVVKMEAGKATAEIGLVLRALKTLGLHLEVRDPALGPATPQPARIPGISNDIESALERARALIPARPHRKNRR